MASRLKGKGEKRKQKGGSSDASLHRRKGGPWLRLVAHPLFAPGVGLWGALLGAGVVAVIPETHIDALTAGTLIATFGVSVKLLTICGFALLLGAALFGVAAARSAAARRRMSPGSVLNAVGRNVNPIDPARDLGSKSIDDPVETMPFASPAWRDADLDVSAGEEEFETETDTDSSQALPGFLRRRGPEVEPDDEEETSIRPDALRARDAAGRADEPQPLPRFMTHPIPDPVPAPEQQSAPLPPQEDAPVELDLAAFAEMPGRNAVWVEAPAAPDAAPVPVAAPSVAAVRYREAPQAPHAPEAGPTRRRRVASPRPAPGSAALARLRAVPTEELSIAEMVERFAGALHEHRASAPVRQLSAGELAAREAALAQAIKALTTLSGLDAEDTASDRDEPLRAALSQLKPRRGAA